MLLAADVEHALEPMRRARKRGGGVAAAEFIVGQHALAGLQRVLDRDRRASPRRCRSWRAARRGAPRRGSSRDDRENRLIVEQDLLVGEQRLVGESGRDVVLAGNVGGGQHRDDALGGAHRGEIEPAQASRSPCRRGRSRYAACPPARGYRRYRSPRRSHAGAPNHGRAACGRPRSLFRAEPAGSASLLFSGMEASDAGRARAAGDFEQRLEQQIGGDARAIGAMSRACRSEANSRRRSRRCAASQLAGSSRSAPISAFSAPLARFGVAAMPP